MSEINSKEHAIQTTSACTGEFVGGAPTDGGAPQQPAPPATWEP